MRIQREIKKNTIIILPARNRMKLSKLTHSKSIIIIYLIKTIIAAMIIFPQARLVCLQTTLPEASRETTWASTRLTCKIKQTLRLCRAVTNSSSNNQEIYSRISLIWMIKRAIIVISKG